jgi:hypothetical protein
MTYRSVSMRWESMALSLSGYSRMASMGMSGSARSVCKQYPGASSSESDLESFLTPFPHSNYTGTATLRTAAESGHVAELGHVNNSLMLIEAHSNHIISGHLQQQGYRKEQRPGAGQQRQPQRAGRRGQLQQRQQRAFCQGANQNHRLQ